MAQLGGIFRKILDKLSTIPENEGSWSLLIIEAAAGLRIQDQDINNTTKGTRVLEEMLDDERVAVEVHKLYL